MSGPAVIQISRGALMAMSAGAGSLYMYVNGHVPEGLTPKDLGMFALKLGSNSKNSNGNNGEDMALVMSPLAMQLSELSAEVARLRSQNQYAVLSYSGRGFSWTTIATVSAAGLVVFYWKGYTLDDIKWVSKTALNMAVETLELSIETLGVALETAKRELTYKLGLVEEKIDETRESLEAKISSEVGEARKDIKNVSNDIQSLSFSQDKIHSMVNNIETQMSSMEGRIDERLETANKGIYLLCNVVADNMSSNVKGRSSQPPTSSGTSLYDELVSYTRSAVSSFRRGGVEKPNDDSRLLLAGEDPVEALRSIGPAADRS